MIKFKLFIKIACCILLFLIIIYSYFLGKKIFSGNRKESMLFCILFFSICTFLLLLIL